MCGIAGFSWKDEQLVRRMGHVIAHRGPDQSGIYCDNDVSLGHQRLSIIDVSEKGRQPMCNEDGSVWVTYNGEIYNYRELREFLEGKGIVNLTGFWQTGRHENSNTQLPTSSFSL